MPSRNKFEKKKKEVAVFTHFEEVLARVHPFGPYQIFCCIVILYASIEWAGNATFMDSLGAVEPDWTCSQNGSSFIVPANTTTSDKCATLKKCDSFKAQKDSAEFYSLRAHFRLICDNNDKVKWIQVIQSGGSLIGSLVGGHLGDFFGRQTIFFIGQLLILISSMLATAAQDWLSFALIMLLNCLLYGLLETTTLTMMMEYTSNKYRLILAACFQWPVAYMVLSLIALLTRDWQNYFVFINLVASPLAIAFMLFLESPRWLIARNELDRACDVLNDIAHVRWNNTKAKFTTRDLSSIHKSEGSPKFYHIFDLFRTRRLAKQTIMQLLATFTYAIVSSTYLYTTSGIHTNAIMFTFLNGVFRIFTPFIIIFLDYRFKRFGRKLQFIGSLTIEALLFAAVILLIAVGVPSDQISVTILVIVTTMMNDCVFWLNIVQITTQRYPTVIRCVAFGTLHAVKHLGAMVGVLFLHPLFSSSPVFAFIVPEILILVTLAAGFFLQPETKGKALMDQMVEGSYGRVENAIPKALIKLAAGHKVRQIEVRHELKKEMAAHEAAANNGLSVDSPWVYKGDSRPNTPRLIPNNRAMSDVMHPQVRVQPMLSSDGSTRSTQDTELEGASNAGYAYDSEEEEIPDDVADDDDYVRRVSREPSPQPSHRSHHSNRSHHSQHSQQDDPLHF